MELDTEKTSPYSQFKGNNYKELEDFLQGQIDAIPVETNEEREKREKREKRVGFLARLADGLGTFHTAFSHARGVKPMEMPKMSARAQELFDKAKAQRDKDNDRYMNLAITLENIKDKDRDFNFRVTQAEQQQSNWQQQFDAGRKDREADVAYRDKVYNTNKTQWQQKFDTDESHWQQQFGEQQRHNRVSEGMDRQRFAASQNSQYTEFYSGNGMIRIPNTRLNQHNISYVFSKTPAEGRPTGAYNSSGQKMPVSADQMMYWIGSNIDNPNVQSALRAIGGVTTNEDNTPPSRRNNNSNTPPSRR